MEELLSNYTKEDLDGAIHHIESQLYHDYVDISDCAFDYVEMDVVRTAIELLKEHLKEKEND